MDKNWKDLSKGWQIFLVVAVFILVVSVGEIASTPNASKNASIQEPSSTSTVSQQEKKPNFVKLNGVDKAKDSGTYGELVVTNINVWKSYGPDRGRVVGTVRHGERAVLLETKTTDQTYYKIRTSAGLIGWVSELFIE